MNNNIKEKLDNFFLQYPEVSFRKGEHVIHASEQISHIYYLTSGYIKQSRNTSSGEELVLHIFKPVSFFPVMIILSNQENQYDFIALDELTLRKAPASDVTNFVKNNPDILFDLASRLSAGLNGMIKKTEDLLFADSLSKLVSLLVYLANRFGEENDGSIKISMPLTHTDIASWIGIQRETVSRKFEYLRKNNIVGYDGKHILIKDLKKLQLEIDAHRKF